MQDIYKNNKDIINKIIILCIFTLSFFVFFRYLLVFVSPIVFGYIISVIIRPLVNILTKKFKLWPGIATIIALIALMSTIGTLIFLGINRLLREGVDFYENLPALIIYSQLVLEEAGAFFQGFYQILPLGVQQGIYFLTDVVIDAAFDVIGEYFRNFGTNFIAAAPRAALTFIIAIITAFFFSKDQKLIRKSLGNILPQNIQDSLNHIKNRLLNALGGYLKAQLIIMSIVAIIGVVSLTIIGATYPLLLGVIIAVVDALPLFGSSIFYIPWIIASLIMGNYFQTIGLAVILITNIFVRQSLEPKILGNQIGIHPILTLSSIYIGFTLFGIIGLFLGPIFAVIFKVIINREEK